MQSSINPPGHSLSRLARRLARGILLSSVIARENIGDRVRKILLDRILDGTYPPCHRLVELDIARELGVSQGPVREIGEREMKEAHEVRATLEQFAAQLAAPRLRGSSRSLRAEVAQMELAADAGDAERLAHHDLAFHQIIVDRIWRVTAE